MSRTPQANNGGGVEGIPARAGFEGERSAGAEDAAGTSKSRGLGEGRNGDGGSDSDAE